MVTNHEVSREHGRRARTGSGSPPAPAAARTHARAPGHTRPSESRGAHQVEVFECHAGGGYGATVKEQLIPSLSVCLRSGAAGLGGGGCGAHVCLQYSHL